MDGRAAEQRGSSGTDWQEVLFVALIVIVVEALLQFVLFLCLQGPSAEERPLQAIFASREEKHR
ncbi:MAG: hypothetical protein HY293_17890 [Planctomycetes bacterium]|nr:hypothetical protein [Planctomycetota bacterium]